MYIMCGLIFIGLCVTLQACALNFSYSDNGLFGFYVVSEPQNAGRVHYNVPYYVYLHSLHAYSKPYPL